MLVAAADTYRAAADEQLEIWAERAGADFVGSTRGGDRPRSPSTRSRRREARGRDVVIVDTAGRLHTQANLMEELTKIRRVIASRLDGAPHETLLVLDATTGQNGLRQAELFDEAVEVTGVALTKLDGTAKGGIVVAIGHELGLPVKLVGVGEGLDDLQPFDAEEFARALVGRRTRTVAGRRRSGGPRGCARSRAPRGPACVRPRERGGPSMPRPYNPTVMFDSLSEKLQGVLGDLRGRGRLSEEDVTKAMREIRLALLEADVNFKVVKEFVAAVKERALGAEVTEEPDARPAGRQDRERGADRADGARQLEARLLRPAADGHLARGPAGLGQDDRLGQARARTCARRTARRLRSPRATSSGRRRWISSNSSASRSRCPSTGAADTGDPVEVARWALEQARAQGRDVLIVDTAGRLHVDEELMDELVAIRKETKPTNVLLVLDAMTGQDAVNVAEAFQERVAFDGVILTKLDGDARGGAALSVKAVTGQPIKFASTGEKLDQLEPFHPDRMASRILGMGDVLTLIEKAEDAAEQDEQEELEARLRAGKFTFDDFLKSYEMMRKMGPLRSVLDMIPGVGKQLQGVDLDDRQLEWVKAIVLSMTPEERAHPEIIKGARRARIARGSGTSVQQVNQLLNGRKQMEKMMKQIGRGKKPNLQSLVTQQVRR